MLEFIDIYAQAIYVSASQNGELWSTGFHGEFKILGSDRFDNNVLKLQTRLDKRIKWHDSASNYGLW